MPIYRTETYVSCSILLLFWAYLQLLGLTHGAHSFHPYLLVEELQEEGRGGGCGMGMGGGRRRRMEDINGGLGVVEMVG